METLHVAFKGASHELALPRGAATTVADAQHMLATELLVPHDAQRWFQTKKRVDTSDATRLLSDVCANTRDAKLYIIAGASASQIDSMKQTQESVLAEQHKRATRRVVSIAKRNDMVTSRDAVATDYRFHAIEELPNFADRHRAREILERLANDRGILAVMDKHRWSVGTLAEMPPDGKVGVDPVCVLGLNQNKGQKILLRLRTDDLMGFRKYLSIKKVLFHELTHNVHSEHDSQFYQLMRQVERECSELDWTNARGAAVGGGANAAIISDDDDDAMDGQYESTGGRKLGGGAVTSRLLLSPDGGDNTSATESRGAHKDDEMKQPSAAPGLTAPSQRALSAVAAASNCCASLAASAQTSDRTVETVSCANEPVAPMTTTATPATQSAPVANAEDVAMIDAAVPVDEVPGHAPSEREQRILDAVRQLRARSSTESASKAGALLHKILSNVAQHPLEDKFRAIRKANKLFATHVAPFPECLAFLRAVGFEDQDERYVLVRQADPVLLWVGRAALEQMLPGIAAA